VHKRKVDDVRKWLVEAFDEKGRARRCVSHLYLYPPFFFTKAHIDDDAAPARPHRSCRFRKDGYPTRSRARNGL